MEEPNTSKNCGKGFAKELAGALYLLYASKSEGNIQPLIEELDKIGLNNVKRTLLKYIKEGYDGEVLGFSGIRQAINGSNLEFGGRKLKSNVPVIIRRPKR